MALLLALRKRGERGQEQPRIPRNAQSGRGPQPKRIERRTSSVQRPTSNGGGVVHRFVSGYQWIVHLGEPESCTENKKWWDSSTKRMKEGREPAQAPSYYYQSNSCLPCRILASDKPQLFDLQSTTTQHGSLVRCSMLGVRCSMFVLVVLSWYRFTRNKDKSRCLTEWCVTVRRSSCRLSTSWRVGCMAAPSRQPRRTTSGR